MIKNLILVLMINVFLVAPNYLALASMLISSDIYESSDAIARRVRISQISFDPTIEVVGSQVLLEKLLFQLELSELQQDEAGGLFDAIRVDQFEGDVEKFNQFLLDYLQYSVDSGTVGDNVMNALKNIAENGNADIMQLYGSLIEKVNNAVELSKTDIPEFEQISDHIKMISFRCIDLYVGNTVDHIKINRDENGVEISRTLIIVEDFLGAIRSDSSVSINELRQSIAEQGLKDLGLFFGFLTLTSEERGDGYTKKGTAGLNYDYQSVRVNVVTAQTEGELRMNIQLGPTEYTTFLSLSETAIDVNALADQLKDDFGRTQKRNSRKSSMRFELKENGDIHLDIESPCAIIALGFTGSSNEHNYTLELLGADSTRAPPIDPSDFEAYFSVFEDKIRAVFGLGVLQEVP